MDGEYDTYNVYDDSVHELEHSPVGISAVMQANLQDSVVLFRRNGHVTISYQIENSAEYGKLLHAYNVDDYIIPSECWKFNNDTNDETNQLNAELLNSLKGVSTGVLKINKQSIKWTKDNDNNYIPEIKSGKMPSSTKTVLEDTNVQPFQWMNLYYAFVDYASYLSNQAEYHPLTLAFDSNWRSELLYTFESIPDDSEHRLRTVMTQVLAEIAGHDKNKRMKNNKQDAFVQQTTADIAELMENLKQIKASNTERYEDLDETTMEHTTMLVQMQKELESVRNGSNQKNEDALNLEADEQTANDMMYVFRKEERSRLYFLQQFLEHKKTMSITKFKKPYERVFPESAYTWWRHYYGTKVLYDCTNQEITEQCERDKHEAEIHHLLIMDMEYGKFDECIMCRIPMYKTFIDEMVTEANMKLTQRNDPEYDVTKLERQIREYTITDQPPAETPSRENPYHVTPATTNKYSDIRKINKMLRIQLNSQQLETASINSAEKYENINFLAKRLQDWMKEETENRDVNYNDNMESMMHMSLDNSRTFVQWMADATHGSGFDLVPQHRWMKNELTFLNIASTNLSYTRDIVNYMVRYTLSRELRHNLLMDNIFDKPTGEHNDGLWLKPHNNYNLYLLAFIDNLTTYFMNNNVDIEFMIQPNKEQFRDLYMYHMVHTAWGGTDRSEWNCIATTQGGRIRSQINYLLAYGDRYPHGDVDLNARLTELIEIHRGLPWNTPERNDTTYHGQSQFHRQRQQEDEMRHRHELAQRQHDYHRQHEESIRAQVELDKQREVERQRLLDEETEGNEARAKDAQLEQEAREEREAQVVRENEVLEKRAEQVKRDEAVARQLQDADQTQSDGGAREKAKAKHKMNIDKQNKVFRKRLDDIVYPPWRKYVQSIYEKHPDWPHKGKKDPEIQAIIVNKVYLILNAEATGEGDQNDQDDVGFTVKVHRVKSQKGATKKQLISKQKKFTDLYYNMTSRLVGRDNTVFKQELARDGKNILAWICFRLMIELSPEIFERGDIIPNGYDNDNLESLQNVNVGSIAYEVYERYMQSGPSQKTDMTSIAKRIFNDVCYVYIQDHDYLIAKQRFRDIYHKFLNDTDLETQLKFEADHQTFFLRDDAVSMVASENSYFVDFI